MAKHGRFARLHVKHKEAHRSLAEFKLEAFREFVTMRLHHFDQQLGSGRHPCVQFATRTNPVFDPWHELFYPSGRKVVPEQVAQLLSPLALAVWFMDDGAADHAGVTLQTHSFKREEVELLVAAMRERFVLEANVRRNKGRWIIYIGSSQLGRLREILEPHILREFGYKLVPRRSRTP